MVKLIFIFLLLSFSLFIRLYQINQNPPGLNIDEANMAYNAYSLGKTGKDIYGQKLPILFRSHNSFQSPLYTYLSIYPVKTLGLNNYSIRLVSIISGVLLVLLSVLFTLKIFPKAPFLLPLSSGVIIALSPWEISFSKTAVEAHLGLAFFALGVLFSLFAFKRNFFLLISCAVLGITTYAYYSYWILGFIYLALFFVIFRKEFNKRWMVLGFLIFTFLQIPYLSIISTSAFFRRIDQVNIFSLDYFYQSGGSFVNFIFGYPIFVVREFLSRYVSYFSFRNLFYDPDPQGVRSIPNLSIFFIFLLPPFLLGIKKFINSSLTPALKILLIIILISPVPAAFTKDPFYTTRVLSLFWALSFVVAWGFFELFYFLRKTVIKVFLSLFLLFLALLLYIFNYSVYFKYERDHHFGYEYSKLVSNLNFMEDAVIDSSRNPGVGIWMAVFSKYEPEKFQEDTNKLLTNGYYGIFESDEQYRFGNIEIRPIFWKEDIYKEQILVGDSLTISESQIKEHKLAKVFEIKNKRGVPVLFGYKTNPKFKCLENLKEKLCSEYLR